MAVSLPGTYLIAQTDPITADRSHSMAPRDYLLIVNEEKEKENRFLESYQDRINSKLYSQIWKNIHYSHIGKIYAYLSLAEHLTKEERKEAVTLLGSSGGFRYADYNRNQSAVFLNALKAYIHSEYMVYPDRSDPKAMYELIGSKLEGYDKFVMQKELLLEVYHKTMDSKLAKLKFEQFEKDAAIYPELVTALKSVYDVELDVLQKEHAPDFKIIMADGSIVSLKDYEGRVVYLSFWASWCAPCIKGFEKYESLRKQLQAEGVVLLNISIDEAPEKFRNALQQHVIVGINGQPMDITATKLLYTLSSIPSYYIIDKNGFLAYLSDDANRDILSEFRKLVSVSK